jgi:pyruvate dehydrogenase E2 component (dihydrolipoamide acetyltransferase)
VASTAYEFRLPDIGEGVVEGEIVRWLVNEGDLLRQDQPMVEIMTDKATVEIPAPRAGRVAKRMFAEGQSCPVGKVLIVIDESGDPAPEGVSPSPPPGTQVPPPASRPTVAAVAPSAAAGVSRSSDVLATPATRKLARDLGVELGGVAGTGPGGRVTSDDVRGAKWGTGTSPRASTSPSPSRVFAAMASRRPT